MSEHGLAVMVANRLSRFICALVVLGWTTIPARTAQIKCVDYYSTGIAEETAQKFWPSGRRPIIGVSCHEGLLTGRIVKGDYETFVSFFKSNHPFLTDFRLNSPGGSVDEATKIGRFFRKHLMTVWAPIDLTGKDNLFGMYAMGATVLAQVHAH